MVLPEYSDLYTNVGCMGNKQDEPELFLQGGKYDLISITEWNVERGNQRSTTYLRRIDKTRSHVLLKFTPVKKSIMNVRKTE